MIKRLVSRIFFHVSRFLLIPLDGRFPRLYMSLYNKILLFMGIKFNGLPRYISTSVRFDDFNKITLSERVVISEKVILLTHDYSLTTGLIALGKTPNSDLAFIRKIIIKENVFIGMGALIMPGTVINSNVIIGAGSVVRGIIPQDSIVIGNPAQVISSLKEKAQKWEKLFNNEELRID